METCDLIIHSAAQILTMKNRRLGIIENGALAVKKDKIIAIGRSDSITTRYISENIINATNQIVAPGFVDCHTHLVFAGSREEEFSWRMQGMSYKEIAEKGGGILTTVTQTRRASEQELFNLALERIERLISLGTTTVEIKSGYGLTTEDELKILRVIQNLQKQSRISIVPTFLGAHSVPPDKSKDRYIKLVKEEMIPEVAEQNLAEFCDVFCENFLFNRDDSKQILEKAKTFGLLPKIHADELESSGGAEVAGEVGAVSAEHLLYPSEQGLEKMKEKDVVSVLLPGTSLFLQSKKIPPVEKMRQLEIPIAIATDCNPGSCPMNSMPLAISLACLLYGLTIEETLVGATSNAAKAINLEKSIGSLEIGKQADILVLKATDYKQIPYLLGHNLIQMVIKKGEIIYGMQFAK